MCAAAARCCCLACICHQRLRRRPARLVRRMVFKQDGLRGQGTDRQRKSMHAPLKGASALHVWLPHAKAALRLRCADETRAIAHAV